jgi:translation initiation factor 4E
MHEFKDKWVLWFHDPSNSDWSLASYENLYTITSIEDFWELFSILDGRKIQEGMFFIMKENIEPLWENEKNCDGGCWSYKINKRDVYQAWVELSIALCIENILKDEENQSIINGISISPKKTFCILKVWNNTSEKSHINLLSKKIPNLFVSQCIYKSHKSR